VYRHLVDILLALSNNKSLVYIIYRPSKTDSAPIRGDGYEPGSSKFRPRANAETSHSVRYDFVVVVVSVGAVVKSFQMVRSRKPPLLVPLYDNSLLLQYSIRAPIRSNMDAWHSISSPYPQWKALTTSHRRTGGRLSANKRANIRPLLTPRAIARGACGHSPLL